MVRKENFQFSLDKGLLYCFNEKKAGLAILPVNETRWVWAAVWDGMEEIGMGCTETSQEGVSRACELLMAVGLDLSTLPQRH